MDNQNPIDDERDENAISDGIIQEIDAIIMEMREFEESISEIQNEILDIMNVCDNEADQEPENVPDDVQMVEVEQVHVDANKQMYVIEYQVEEIITLSADYVARCLQTTLEHLEKVAAQLDNMLRHRMQTRLLLTDNEDTEESENPIDPNHGNDNNANDNNANDNNAIEANDNNAIEANDNVVIEIDDNNDIEANEGNDIKNENKDIENKIENIDNNGIEYIDNNDIIIIDDDNSIDGNGEDEPKKSEKRKAEENSNDETKKICI